MIANSKIAFIGAGNMAYSLISGLVNSGINPQNIYASNHDVSKLSILEQQFKIMVNPDNKVIAKDARIILLCVKPNKINFVLEELKDILLAQNPLLISLAAGTPIEALELILGKHLSIVRAMPNTPAVIRAGATGLYANGLVSENEQSIAESIFRSVGLVIWAKHEKELDIITALSGSGPAYAFYLMEAMEKAGTDAGLSPETARLLTIQTIFGASKLALEDDENPQVLREKVTSPHGVTEAAIMYLEQQAVGQAINHAIGVGIKRAEEITKMVLKACKGENLH